MNDPFAVLEIDSDAGSAEIRAAYLQLARLHHPDRHTGARARRIATRRMQRINEAYEVLKDPDRRRECRGRLAAAAERRTQRTKDGSFMSSPARGGRCGLDSRIAGVLREALRDCLGVDGTDSYSRSVLLCGGIGLTW